MKIVKYRYVVLILIVSLLVGISGCVSDSQPPTTLPSQKVYSEPDMQDGSAALGGNNISKYDNIENAGEYNGELGNL